MHEYYAANKDKFRKGMDQFLSLVAPELEKKAEKSTRSSLKKSGITMKNIFLNASPMSAATR
jgi:hypothetical protein